MVQQTDTDWINDVLSTLTDGGEFMAAEGRAILQNLRDSVAFAPVVDPLNNHMVRVVMDQDGLMSLESSTIAEEGNQNRSLKTLQVPGGGGISFANWLVQARGQSISVTDVASNRTFIPCGVVVNDAGSGDPFFLNFGPFGPQFNQDQTDISIGATSDTVQFSASNLMAGEAAIYSFRRPINAAVARDCNIQIRLNSFTDPMPVLDYKRDHPQSQGFDLQPGMTAVPLPVRTFFEMGVPIFVTITSDAGDNLNFLGTMLDLGMGPQPIPATQIDGQAATITRLARHDELPGSGTMIAAENVSYSTDETGGLFANIDNVKAALDLVDGTGLGAQPRTFTGTFFGATFGQNGNQGIWFGGRQSVEINTAGGQANGVYSFVMPDLGDLGAMFDALAARGLPEVFRIRIGHTAGSTQLISRNRLVVSLPSGANPLSPPGTFPATFAQGSSGVFRIERIGGNIQQWELIETRQTGDPVAIFGGLQIQARGWNNADSSILPSSSEVQQGYMFKVFGSNPNDGTLRQGLLDSGVSDRVIFDDDYVIWDASSFTSWADGDNWFILTRNDVQRLTRDQTDFLNIVREIDNRVDVGFVSAMNARALVWLSENQLADAPFIDPSTDQNNPRPGDDYAYVGGEEDRNANLQFQIGRNFFNAWMTVGISPNFVAAHQPENISIRIRELEGGILPGSQWTLDQLTFVDTATFTNSTFRHYQLPSSINYPALATIEIVLTEVQDHYTLDPNRYNAVPNIPDDGLEENKLSPAVREKLNRALPDPGVSFDQISEQLSPIIEVQNRAPDIDARFLDGAPDTPFPHQLSDFTQVSADRPRFRSTQDNMFVAVGQPGAFLLINHTADTETPLQQGAPGVDVIESISGNGTTYFVYHITGLTPNQTYEVDKATTDRVAEWAYRIQQLRSAVDLIQVQLQHAALNLPDALVHVLQGVVVNEEDTPSETFTDYNASLGGADNTTQTVFREPAPVPGSGGTKASQTFDQLTGGQQNQKLIYFPADAVFTNSGSLVRGTDGTTTRNLINYQDGTFNALKFVPARPAGSYTETVYPAQASKVSGEGIWQTIEAEFISDQGIPTSEADEIFFTRNIPTTPTTVRIQYRGHANGNIFGTAEINLPNVGGAAASAVTFTLDDGSETLTLEARYFSSTRRIRISEVPTVRQGLPTINDAQVILSYQETRTIPAVPQGVNPLPIESLHPGTQIFGIKRNAAGNVVIVGEDVEVDINRSFDDVFGSARNGNLIVENEDAQFFNFQDFDLINTTVRDLQNHSELPGLDLFRTIYTHETTVKLGTQLEVLDPNGNPVSVGSELLLRDRTTMEVRRVYLDNGSLETEVVT